MVSFHSSIEALRLAADGCDRQIGYSLFRYGYGLLLLLFMGGYLMLRHALAGDLAILPHADFSKHRLRPLGLHDLMPDTVATGAAIGIGVTGAVALLATRIPAGFIWPAVWISLCSLQGRNPHFIYGGDDLFRLLSVAFLLDFTGEVPCGVFAARVLVMAVYWNTATHKLLEEEWTSGNALYGFAKLTMIRRLPVPFMDNPSYFRACSYLALLVECAIPVLLLFSETTVWAIGLALLLHVTLQIFYRIHLFQFVMMCGLLLFPSDAQYRHMAQLFGFSSATDAAESTSNTPRHGSELSRKYATLATIASDVIVR